MAASGYEVKREVVEALDREHAWPPGLDEAFAPCVVLTAEEALSIRACMRSPQEFTHDEWRKRYDLLAPNQENN